MIMMLNADDGDDEEDGDDVYEDELDDYEAHDERTPSRTRICCSNTLCDCDGDEDDDVHKEKEKITRRQWQQQHQQQLPTPFTNCSGRACL